MAGLSIEATMALIGTGIMALTSFVGLVVWLTKLDGKVQEVSKAVENEVKLTDTKHQSLKELIETRFDAQDSRLIRIERALNGSLYLEH